jgi:rhodanese-related sulfurtransferase
MLGVMLRWLPTSLLALITLASLGCELGSGDPSSGAGSSDGWGLAGIRLIREVSAGEGLRLLEDPETVLVQVREPTRRTNRVAGTEIVSARDPLPSHVTESSATVVILAEDASEGMRVAARLSRAGIRDVAIVRGGVAAWEAARRSGDPEHKDGSPQGAAKST